MPKIHVIQHHAVHTVNVDNQMVKQSVHAFLALLVARQIAVLNVLSIQIVHQPMNVQIKNAEIHVRELVVLELNVV